MVVVTTRGTCARVARAVFGDEAGAAAVVMINNTAGYPPFEGQITSNPDTGEQHTVTIPFLGVRNNATDVRQPAGGRRRLGDPLVDHGHQHQLQGRCELLVRRPAQPRLGAEA